MNVQSQRVLRGAALSLLSVAFATSFASTRLDNVADSQYLALGAEAQYDSVGQVELGGSGFGCGVLIGSQWVLTAAHVAQGASSSYNQQVYFGSSAYSVSNIYVDPAWNGNLIQGNDFALVKLSAPVTNVAATTMWQGDVPLGTIGTSIGFGKSGTGLTGGTTSDGLKRGFTNSIDASNPLIYIDNAGNTQRWDGFITDFDNPAGTTNTLDGAGPGLTSSAKPTALEGAIAEGDSGGGLFVNLNGQNYLIGTTSYGAGPQGQPLGLYGDLSAYAEIAQGASWIQSVSGIQAAPEPAELLPIALGVMGLVARRRRK